MNSKQFERKAGVILPKCILEVSGIVKTFPGVKALNGVNLRVMEGEVHAVVGENGAGKSTLMLTLGGVYKPDAGEIFIDGEQVHFESARDANEKGISVVYQELSLVQNLSVAENIFANRQPVNAFNIINKNQLYKKTKEMLAMFNMTGIKPDMLVKELSIADQQIVEILKAMSFDPKVLILDEPTSSLTELEVRQLFKNIGILKEKGIAIIYISHHLREIFEIADSVTIMRDGEYVCDKEIKAIDEEFLVTRMVGRKVENIYGTRSADNQIGETVFEVRGLTRKGIFEDISFSIGSGEIVGFAGLIGAGRTEVGRAIFGLEPPDEGLILLDGEEIKIPSVSHAIEHQIGYATEDRKSQGLYLNFTIEKNLIANRLKAFTRRGFLKTAAVREYAEKNVGDFHVAAAGIHQVIGTLSGGNQQKVLLGMWFGIHPRLLIVDEPTRGIDIGAKSEIYALLRKLAASGVAIMMISSDLPEILGVSDRIIVMKNGRISGKLSCKDATEDKIISSAAGTAVSSREEI